MSPICVVSHTYAWEISLKLGQKFREAFHSSLEGSGWFRMVWDGKSGPFHEAFSMRLKAAVSGAALRDWLAEAGAWNLFLGQTRQRTEDL